MLWIWSLNLTITRYIRACWQFDSLYVPTTRTFRSFICFCFVWGFFLGFFLTFKPASAPSKRLALSTERSEQRTWLALCQYYVAAYGSSLIRAMTQKSLTKVITEFKSRSCWLHTGFLFGHRLLVHVQPVHAECLLGNEVTASSVCCAPRDSSRRPMLCQWQEAHHPASTGILLAVQCRFHAYQKQNSLMSPGRAPELNHEFFLSLLWSNDRTYSVLLVEPQT